MELIQPDEARPWRMLGVCRACGGWCVAVCDGRSVVVTALPDLDPSPDPWA